MEKKKAYIKPAISIIRLDGELAPQRERGSDADDGEALGCHGNDHFEDDWKDEERE